MGYRAESRWDSNATVSLYPNGITPYSPRLAFRDSDWPTLGHTPQFETGSRRSWLVALPSVKKAFHIFGARLKPRIRWVCGAIIGLSVGALSAQTLDQEQTRIETESGHSFSDLVRLTTVRLPQVSFDRRPETDTMQGAAATRPLRSHDGCLHLW